MEHRTMRQTYVLKNIQNICVFSKDPVFCLLFGQGRAFRCPTHFLPI